MPPPIPVKSPRSKACQKLSWFVRDCLMWSWLPQIEVATITKVNRVALTKANRLAGFSLVTVGDHAVAFWCKVVRTSVANPRCAVVADALAFVANCGYWLRYQRQLSANAFLTFANKEKPAEGRLGLVLRPSPEKRLMLTNRLANR